MHSPKLQHCWNITIGFFNVINRTLVGDLISLLKCSWCILPPPQPTGSLKILASISSIRSFYSDSEEVCENDNGPKWRVEPNSSCIFNSSITLYPHTTTCLSGPQPPKQEWTERPCFFDCSTENLTPHFHSLYVHILFFMKFFLRRFLHTVLLIKIYYQID